MRWDRNNVRPGMFVTSTDGEKIGKVIRCGAETFVVEKGVLFPKDYELRYDHITDVRGDNLSYALTEAIRREARTPAAAEATRFAPAAAATPKPEPATPLRSASTGFAPSEKAREVREAEAQLGPGGGEEIRIPLSKEEIDVERVPRETGHVRIHKTVKVEERHFTVPITREEVVIEHVAAAPGDTRAPATSTFQEQIVDVPVHEEELRVTKHPVLREEMVVRTVAHSVEKEASATLRREEVEVEDTRPTAARGTATTTPATEGYSSPGARR
jgi:uncharacterized protein (TIGR02271 family)